MSEGLSGEEFDDLISRFDLSFEFVSQAGATDKPRTRITLEVDSPLFFALAQQDPQWLKGFWGLTIDKIIDNASETAQNVMSEESKNEEQQAAVAEVLKMLKGNGQST